MQQQETQTYISKLPADIQQEIRAFSADAAIRAKISEAIEKAGKTLPDTMSSYAYFRNTELQNYIEQYPMIVAQILEKKFLKADLNAALRAALDSATVDFNKAKVLVLAGADANTKNLIGQTFLEFAVLPTRSSKAVIGNDKANDIVKILLSHGADPNVNFFDKSTPLYVAIFKKNKDLVKILLDAGANVYKKYKKGQFELESPLELVRDGEDFPDLNDPIRLMIEEAALKQTPETAPSASQYSQ